MKIFITGGTGFIGSHLVRCLYKKGFDLTVNLRKGKISSFENEIKTFYFNQEKPEQNTDFFKKEKFDGVVHLASLYITTHTARDIDRLIDSNVKFGAQVLDCASQAGIGWFINAGTSWQNYQNKEYSPVNLYASTKQAFEDIARYYIDANLIKFFTIRLFDTYGRGDTRRKILTLWKEIAYSGITLDMSPGDQLIDLTYIDDVVDGFVAMINNVSEKKGSVVNGGIYSIKAEKRYTLKELSKIFEEVIGKKLNINWGEKPYRKREVMIPWEEGEIVPNYRPNHNIYVGIKAFLDNNY